MPWVTREQVREQWADAPLDDELLDHLIDAAQEQCEAYAPALPDPGDGTAPVPPARYVQAVVQQVRALGQAMDRDGDVLGFGDGFAVRVRPLAADVKALLRPRQARPIVR